MSTVATEPPPADVQQKAVEAQSAPKDSRKEPMTFNLSDALKRHSKKTRPDSIKSAPPADPPKEEKKKEEQKQEPPKEEKKPEPPQEKKPDVSEKPNSEHFKVVTGERDAAKAERDAARKELEELKKRLETDPPDAYKTKLTEREKELEDLRKRHEEAVEKMRAVDVTLDPEYEKQYVQPVKDGMKNVFNLLVRAGVESKEAEAAVNAWDDSSFETLIGGVGELHKSRIHAAIAETERLNRVRLEQVESPEKFRQAQQENQRKASERYTQELEREGTSLIDGLLHSTPELSGEEHKPLMEELRKDIGRIARREMTPKEIMAAQMQARTLQIGLSHLASALEERDATIAEKDKKIAELEKFVSDHGGATLRSEAGQPPADGEKYVPIAKRMVVSIPAPAR